MKAASTNQDLSSDVAILFSTYAGAIADQGQLVTAAKYCRYVPVLVLVCVKRLLASLILFGILLTIVWLFYRGDSEQSKILRDRLYRSQASQQCLQMLGTPPPFPFSMTAPKKTQAVTNAARAQNQALAATQNVQRQSHPVNSTATISSNVVAPAAAMPGHAAVSAIICCSVFIDSGR